MTDSNIRSAVVGVAQGRDGRRGDDGHISNVGHWGVTDMIICFAELAITAEILQRGA